MPPSARHGPEGKTAFGSAKTEAAMEAVVRNTMIQGILSIVFVVLRLIVIITAILATVKAFRDHSAGMPMVDNEDRPLAVPVHASSGADRRRRSGSSWRNGRSCRSISGWRRPGTTTSALASGFRGSAPTCKGSMGADAYAKYLEHHAATGHAEASYDRT